MRSKPVRLLVAALTGMSAALVGIGIVTTPASAGHNWSNYHWATSSYPINLRPVNSLGPRFRDQGVAAAVNTDWNQSRKFANQQRYWNNGVTVRSNCPYPDDSFRMCNHNWGATGWAGLAQIRVSTSGHILTGRARVNDYYGTSYNYRRHVLCQEYGHVLGLGHQADGNHSCMDDSAQGWDELSPNGHDYDMLLRIYDHRHASASSAETGDSHVAPSRSVPDTVVTRLPDGDLLVTYIVWAPHR